MFVGWAPSQFVSSRADKANLNSRKPEDFMDEEVSVWAVCFALYLLYSKINYRIDVIIITLGFGGIWNSTEASSNKR